MSGANQVSTQQVHILAAQHGMKIADPEFAKFLAEMLNRKAQADCDTCLFPLPEHLGKFQR